jgi:ABC-2 type transport system ATP-binding protein
MIRLENIEVRYGETVAVDNLSFTFNEGHIYGIIGPNGAGKSSLIKAMVGIITDHSGNIFFEEHEYRKKSREIKFDLGYAPETTELFDYLTAREYLQMITEIKRLPADHSGIEDLLAKLTLEDQADHLIVGYSHGMRKKTALAAALLGSPRYIMLDEALNGLDPVAMYNVRQLLRSFAGRQSTILLSSHILELVENWCDHILIMKDGRLLATYSQDQIRKICAESGSDFSAHFIRLVEGSD